LQAETVPCRTQQLALATQVAQAVADHPAPALLGNPLVGQEHQVKAIRVDQAAVRHQAIQVVAAAATFPKVATLEWTPTT
jgi:hypothetical protein